MNDLPRPKDAPAVVAPPQEHAAGIVTTPGISAVMLRPQGDLFLGRRITPLTRRRIDNFRANRRGFWSLWIFLALFGTTLFAEFLANDRPLLVSYAGSLYMPVLHDYPETTFGGDFPSQTDYRDPAVIELISEKGWMVWPLIPFGYRTITDAPGPYPAAPSSIAWLGTDDQGRDVLARLIYGFRISVLFGLALTLFSSIVGVAARALGVGDGMIIWRHVLPNATVATITFMPFILNGSITTLTSLDFLGFGLPPGSPSLGELLAQGKANLQAPWLGLTAFFVLASMLSLLIFVGEAVRDAFDPRKVAMRRKPEP